MELHRASHFPGRAWGGRVAVVTSAVGLLVMATLGETAHITTPLRLAITAALLVLLLLGHPRARRSRAGSASGSRTQAEAWQRVRWELDRARRHGRRLCVASLPTPSADGERQRLLADVLASVRGSDDAWVERGRLLLMLPDVPPDGARECVRRLRQHGVPSDDPVRVVAFPDDALTVGALRDALTRPLLDLPVPRSPSPAQRPDGDAVDDGDAMEPAS
jgi:hypothetical protein